eukprot:sb/3472478/
MGGRNDLKVTELKNKRICLPGYDPQGAWETPLGYFAWRGWFDPSERCNPLWTATRYFGNSCLPDQSSSIPDHWKICAACSQGTCSAETQFSGQSGALRCITTGAGDVAFVHLKAALSKCNTWSPWLLPLHQSSSVSLFDNFLHTSTLTPLQQIPPRDVDLTQVSM